MGLYSLQSHTDFDKKIIQYKKNRDMLMYNLPKLGFTNILCPDGAFYLYAEISNFESSSV